VDSILCGKLTGGGMIIRFCTPDTLISPSRRS